MRPSDILVETHVRASSVDEGLVLVAVNSVHGALHCQVEASLELKRHVLRGHLVSSKLDTMQ
jgi:hypothetical protein